MSRLRRKGFTLIEMAIVLVIMGVVLVLLVPPLANMVKANKNREGKTALTSIKDQIIGYAMDHGQLPPLDTNSGSTAGKPLTTALGNPIDPWRQPFRYLPNPAICESNTQAVDICDASTNSASTDYVGDDVLRILDANGNTIDFVAFVVASKGHDQQLDVTDMQLPAAGASDTPWSLAPPVGGWQHDVDLNPAMASGNINDDLVEFVTLLELKAMMCADTGAEGGGNEDDDPNPHSEHDPYVVVTADAGGGPTTSELYGDGDPSAEGYDGVYFQNSTRLTEENLAAVVTVNWVAEYNYNLEVIVDDGNLGPIWPSGYLRWWEYTTYPYQYLRQKKGVALPFDFNFSIISQDLVRCTLTCTSDGTLRREEGYIPTVLPGYTRVVGNFWVQAMTHSTTQYATATDLTVNNFDDPDDLEVPYDASYRVHYFVAQRDEAVENFQLTGNVTVNWQGGGYSYPSTDELGMQIGLLVHDVPTP